MKRTHFALVVLLAALTMASGCGTVCNLASGDPKLYGGCEQDPIFTHPIKFSPPHVSNGSSAVGAAVVGLLFPGLFYGTEIGLDLAGDTLTLPIIYLLRTPDDPADSKPDQATRESYPDPSEFTGAGAVIHP
jgi:hypothetical protein